MAFDMYKSRILTEVFNLAGQVVSSQLLKPDYDSLEKTNTAYYNNMKAMVRKGAQAKTKKAEIPEPVPIVEQTTESIPLSSPDMTHEKIEAGISCLPCSNDHFSTVSGALSEALRFARKEGVQHHEVQRRIGMALDELNMLERIDLSAESIVGLEGEDKAIAEWGLDKSRNLRHRITAIRDARALEKVSAEASTIRTEFMRKLWNVATVDGSIDKVCKNLSGEKREKCMAVINAVIVEKKQTPP